MAEKIGNLWLFLRFCTKLKNVLLPRMSCKMPVKAVLHPRLSGAQQPDDERLYSYRVTTNRFFSSYSALKLPFEDKGQNILNDTIPDDPNYHVKTFKISWTRHDHLNKNQRQLACLKSFIMVAQLWYQLGSKIYASRINQHINIVKCKYEIALEVFWKQVLVSSFIKMAHIGSYGLIYFFTFLLHKSIFSVDFAVFRLWHEHIYICMSVTY